MINVREKVYTWVEDKIGEEIEKEINMMIESKENIEVENYAKKLVNSIFNDVELTKLKENIFTEENFDDDLSMTETLEEVIDVEGLDLSALSIKEGSSNVQVEKACKDLLQSFEYLSADEVLSQPFWPAMRKVLQNVLIFNKGEGSNKMALFSLKVFKRLLSSHHSPKTVCEGFSALAEVVTKQIEAINKQTNVVESEELYDIRENKVYRRSSHRRRIEPELEDSAVDTLLRSTHLLISAHDNMPGAWLRFNERRLHNIISTFVHMLSSSFAIEKRNVSAFDIITILQPRGNWCRHWTHSATGRMLLCQTLRKHQRFFHSIVEIVTSTIIAHQEKTPRKRSALKKDPTTSTDKVSLSILGIPEDAKTKARFCHSFTILSHLVQFRAGRALFPHQTSSRRRPWSVQDLVGLMMDYIQTQSEHKNANNSISPVYMHHLMEMARMLMNVEDEILSARGTQNQRRRR